MTQTALVRARRLTGLAGRALRDPGAATRKLVVRAGYFWGPRLMSELRKRWVLLRNPHATIRFGKGNYLGPGFSLHMPYGGTFITGDWIEFRRKFRAEVGPNGRIEIGTASFFTYDVIISCDTSIVIGERCGFGQCTYVADGSHRFRDITMPFLAQGYDYRPLHIGDDAVVHSKCTVVNDIGTRAVIGANAVVSRPIPPYCLAVGVPARVIDYFGPPGGEPQGFTLPSSLEPGAPGGRGTPVPPAEPGAG
jgi:acetyltransferase-like isoleucine patch superfamily enzyme